MATLIGNARNFLNVQGAVPCKVTTLGKSVVVSGRHPDRESEALHRLRWGVLDDPGRGDYEVVFNGTDRFQIQVPNNDNTMAFLDCVNSSITQPNLNVPGSSWPSFPRAAIGL